MPSHAAVPMPTRQPPSFISEISDAAPYRHGRTRYIAFRRPRAVAAGWGAHGATTALRPFEGLRQLRLSPSKGSITFSQKLIWRHHAAAHFCVPTKAKC
ncbi:hypothetical protein RHIZ404_90011 [Rhizobium sp. EC-SD404]|nr:hypothetical protein RHIZ404_90011 [Rhizobium sp. EC-SD404]